MGAFRKEVLRSITHSWGRFLAIAVMAALGCGFYAGLRMTGPDMRLAGDEYYDATELCDLRVVSSLGMSDEQVDMLRGVEGVSGVMPAYEADAISQLAGVQYTLRYHSLYALSSIGIDPWFKITYNANWKEQKLLQPQSAQYQAMMEWSKFCHQHPEIVDQYTTRCDVLKQFEKNL